MNRFGLPALGVGLGLRTAHYPAALEHRPEVGWFEIISENFMQTAGRPLAVLDDVSHHYPLVMHGVSLSIGSTDPLDIAYLHELKALRDRCGARWVSDHLCWTGVGGRNVHDLLPMPFTEEALNHVVSRIRIVQEVLEAPLVLENPSSYLQFADDQVPEWEFLAAVASEADCGLLLDVNNLYVSAHNHGFSVSHYLDSVPWSRVVQLHVAGHSVQGELLIDTHVGPVPDPVLSVLKQALRRLDAPTSVLLEWDTDVPTFDVAAAEVQRIAALIDREWTEARSLAARPHPARDRLTALARCA